MAYGVLYVERLHACPNIDFGSISNMLSVVTFLSTSKSAAIAPTIRLRANRAYTILIWLLYEI